MDTDRIRAVFLAAVELPPDQRNEFVQSQCANDAQLYQEVCSLLKYHTKSTLISPTKDQNGQNETAAMSNRQRSNDTVYERLSVLSNSKTISWLRRSVNRLWDNWLLLSILSLIAVVIITWRIDNAITTSIRRAAEKNLQAISRGQSLAVQSWLDAEFRVAQNWARNPQLQNEVIKLDRLSRDPESNPELIKASGVDLRELMKELSSDSSDLRYAVWNSEFRLIADADSESPVIGNRTTPLGGSIISKVLAGKSALWLPTVEGYITTGFENPPSMSKSSIALLVPVSDVNSRAFAVLMIAGIAMQDRFEEIFETWRIGRTGESYAVTSKGYFVTESRFDSQLNDVGLWKEFKGTTSQVLRVAEPPVPISASNFSPAGARSWPLTKSAAQVTAHESGFDSMGYNDYRGEVVFGAWNWLKDYEFGIIFELDKSEAFEALKPLRWIYGSLILGLVTVSCTLAYRSVLARRNAGLPNELGPFRVQKKIGEGGMAMVFLATHSLLKRETAIKIIRPEQYSWQNAERFEREVRLTSRLSHPNTVEVYDFGKIKDGRFFFAMEYIRGYNLQQVIELSGPLSSGRVARILYEVCRSLREAHHLGIVHRDIKLQNIMLSRRAAEFDCVKVLDFGLAKQFNAPAQLTETHVLVGTPIYIPPERIADPTCMDARSDIFALGVVAQILLTGQEPLLANSSIDALYKTLKHPPQRSSELTALPIPPVLDQLVHNCQHRDPNDRPQSVDDIIKTLSDSGLMDSWSDEDAQQWWQAHPLPEFED